jgi:acetolactate synthase I/II/III large subunit
MDTNEARHSAAHYFLEGLNEIGIDYLFCNFGTDHAPLIEAMAGFKRDGRKMPGTILCPHEVTAVHMAAGYAMPARPIRRWRCTTFAAAAFPSC